VELDEYVAARYGRLVEHAVLLGAPEGEAGTYVDRVLLEQRKRIRRADDPDPIVYAALEQALSGERPKTRSTGPLVALGVVALAAVVAVALSWHPAPERVPSLFGLDGDQARARLEAQGFEADVRPVRACEPVGLVVGSDPVSGALLADGGTVTVRTAVPSGTSCEAIFFDRSDAWAFVRFAMGVGEAPEFAQTVHVVVDRSEDATLTHADAVRRARWGGVLDRFRTAAQTGDPALEVTSGVPPESTCGVPRPPQGGERPTLRAQIDGQGGCALTVDLYQSDEGAGTVIDSVVIYTGDA
jgi:hypothetical protein